MNHRIVIGIEQRPMLLHPTFYFLCSLLYISPLFRFGLTEIPSIHSHTHAHSRTRLLLYRWIIHNYFTHQINSYVPPLSLNIWLSCDCVYVHRQRVRKTTLFDIQRKSISCQCIELSKIFGNRFDKKYTKNHVFPTDSKAKQKTQQQRIRLQEATR